MRERYYKTTTDSSLTMDQKLEIIEGVRRGVVSLKSKMIDLPEFDDPIDFRKLPYFFKVFNHNSQLVDIWTDLTLGELQPRSLFKNERLATIGMKARQISRTTNAPFDKVYDDYCAMMSKFITPYL
jgi:hypothetical protein